MAYRSYYTFLLIGVTAYMLASLCIIYEVTPFIITALELQVMLAISWAFHLLFYNSNSWNRHLFNIHRLFARVIAFGISAVLLATFGASSDAFTALPTAVVRMFKMASVYAVVSYLLYAITMLRKLMFVRRNVFVVRQWRSLMSVLILSLLMGLPAGIIPATLQKAVLLTGLLVAASLLNRIKWIAELTRRDKWMAVFYLLIASLLNIAAFQVLYHATGLEYVLLTPFSENTFLLTLFAATGSYCLFSMLALLFTMPVSSVIEEQLSEINSFQEIGLALQRKDSTEDIFHRLFQVCLKNTSGNAGWLILHPFKATETCHFTEISSEQIGRINVWMNFRELIKTENDTGYHYFPNLDRHHIFAETETPYKSLLVLPIFTKPHHCEGVICLTKTFADGFDQHMIGVCKSFINQAKLAFENAQLTQEAIRSARYKEELDIANKVQRALLPQKFPETPFIEIAALNEPAREVGGDYYDYAQIDPRRFALIMADVSGKGASAAFHMAQMKGIFQSLIQLNLSATDFMLMANRSVARCLEKNQFITAIFAQFNFETNMLTYVRAGHTPMIYYSAAQNKARLMEGEGLGLGILRNSSYAKFIGIINLPLYKDDVLVLYTDGLVEGRKNESAEEQYGYQNLMNCVENNHQLSATQISNAIYEDFAAFTQNSNFKDDTSVLVIKIGQLEEGWKPNLTPEPHNQPIKRSLSEKNDK